jgi:hypothetical protein
MSWNNEKVYNEIITRYQIEYNVRPSSLNDYLSFMEDNLMCFDRIFFLQITHPEYIINQIKKYELIIRKQKLKEIFGNELK